MRNVCTSLGLFLATFLGFGTPAEQLPKQLHCQPGVPTIPGNHYSYGDREDRCEGVCRRPLSNTTQLRVVGFSRGTVFSSPVASSELSVQWHGPDASAFRLEVSASAGVHCYRMDTHQTHSTTSFRWSPRIINALGIRADHLSALVWAIPPSSASSRPLVVPIESGGSRQSSEPYVVEVVPAREFQRISYTLTSVSSARPYVSEQSLDGGYYPSGRRQRLRLPRDLPTEVPLRLRIIGRYPGGSNSTEVTVWVPR
jgi:hypothetical protein